MHPENHRWVTGDQFGLAFPADPAGLRSGGTRFLTDAFRAAGLLGGDNNVTRITEFHEVAGGSTGRKVALAVEYGKAAAGLHTSLFVKFSRDLDNPLRDRGKTQMEPEVRFASLSRVPGFPIAVPQVQFGDYHRRSGTGILITERIRYGDRGIERHYHKCLDYEMPEPLDHYRALLTALARLAGTHRSGRLPAGLNSHFPLGVAWLLDVPALMRRRFGADLPGRRWDPRIKDDESVRAPLQMLSNLLNLWERHHPGDLLDAALADSGPRLPEGDEGRCVG
jgi:hypothetical protein